jgi:hypothetical protein
MSDYSKLKFADGSTAIVQIIALHRRRPHSLGVVDRPTDWLAQAGKHAAWGRTRREAFERLRELVGADADPANAGRPVRPEWRAPKIVCE